MHHLMDGVDPGHLAAAGQAATSIDGVLSATVLARWTGRILILHVEAHLDPEVTLVNASRITHRIDRAVQAAGPEASPVHSHAHPVPRPGFTRLGSR